jgi:septum formation protein
MTASGSKQDALFLTLQPLILASASPRRMELLRSVGLSFDVAPSGVNEVNNAVEAPDALARRWASEKAQSVAQRYKDRWILAADTIVVLGGVVFGKPADAVEAEFMLRQLSGRSHDVISGVCLIHRRRHVMRIQSVRTQVQFRDLGREEILSYVGTGEPLDKAGAYGIQGMGAFMVRSISGSYTNVVGLPLCETLEWLLKERVITPVEKAAGHSK